MDGRVLHRNVRYSGASSKSAGPNGDARLANIAIQGGEAAENLLLSRWVVSGLIRFKACEDQTMKTPPFHTPF